MPKVTLFYAQSDPRVTLNDLCPKWLKIYALSDPPALYFSPSDPLQVGERFTSLMIGEASKMDHSTPIFGYSNTHSANG